MLGLAVGVALLFASQVASASLSGSVAQLTSEIVGQMQFQLESRDPRGFDERMLGEVQRLPGVSAAVPVLEQPPTRSDRPAAGRWTSSASTRAWRSAAARSVRALPLRPDRSPAGARAARVARAKRSARSRWRRSSSRSARAPSPPWSAPTLDATRSERSASARSWSRRWPTRRSWPGCTGVLTRIFVQLAAGREPRCGRACGGWPQAAERRAGRTSTRSCSSAAAARPTSREPVRGDQRARRLPVRVQRDAADGASAPGPDRRPAHQRRHARTSSRRCCSTRSCSAAWRALAGLGARRPALDRRVPRESRLPVLCIPGRLAADRHLAERRDGRGRGAARGVRRRARPAPGDLLPPGAAAPSGRQHARRRWTIGWMALSAGWPASR